jgi:gamma-glutamylcyclotransferase (GGCT)/AIG2-like uncharacterized protein YtfP
MRDVRHSLEAATRPVGLVDRLFVYGSLRTGQTARGLVEPYVREWSPATVRGSMYAFSSGYPGVVLEATGGIVMGELLWLRDLTAALPVLDAWEGDDYDRVLVQVDHLAGTTWSWIYVLADPRVAALGTPVPEGEWIAQRVAPDLLGQPAT